jgi:hypothetical protein
MFCGEGMQKGWRGIRSWTTLEGCCLSDVGLLLVLCLDLSDAKGEEGGTRFWLRHLHRIRDHHNYIGDCNVEEEQEIGSDEEDEGKEKEDLGGLLKLKDKCKSGKEFVGDMTSSCMHQLSGEVIN